MLTSFRDLPIKTIRILKVCHDANGKATMATFVAGSWDEETARIKNLKDICFIEEGSPPEIGSPPALIVTPQGEAFLTDFEYERRAEKSNNFRTIIISAITAAVVSILPDILRLILSRK